MGHDTPVILERTRACAREVEEIQSILGSGSLEGFSPTGGATAPISGDRSRQGADDRAESRQEQSLLAASADPRSPGQVISGKNGYNCPLSHGSHTGYKSRAESSSHSNTNGITSC